MLYQDHRTTTWETRNLVPATQAEIDAFFLQAQREFIWMTAGLFAASFAGAPVQFADVSGEPNAVMIEQRRCPAQAHRRSAVALARSG